MNKPYPLSRLYLLLLFAIGFVHGAPQGRGTPSTALDEGKRVYHANCEECHGSQGRGDGPKALKMGFHPRDFTLGAFKCRCTPSGQLPTDEDLLRTVTNGMHGTPMQAHENMSLQDRQAVIQYVKTLSPGFMSGVQPRCIDIPQPLPATEKTTLEGKQVYRVLNCWKCHGPKGRGDGPAAADLKDDWGRPIRAYNFTMGRRFKCGGDDSDIYRTLLTGMTGSPMPSWEEALLFTRDAVTDFTQYKGAYGATDLEDLAAYLRQQPTAAELKVMLPAAKNDLVAKRAWSLVHYLKSLVSP
jgi:mono/diheme cytochrome c family protein